MLCSRYCYSTSLARVNNSSTARFARAITRSQFWISFYARALRPLTVVVLELARSPPSLTGIGRIPFTYCGRRAKTGAFVHIHISLFFFSKPTSDSGSGYYLQYSSSSVRFFIQTAVTPLSCNAPAFSSPVDVFAADHSYYW